MSHINSIKQLLVLAFVICLVVSTAFFVRHLNGPRIVARAVSPEGVEMCIVQRCNWSGEPFTTSFYCRKPGTNWAWFYYSHQDWYWRHSRVSLDPNAQVAKFYRGTNAAITFDWKREIYWKGHRIWTTGAQSYLPSGESPWMGR